MMNSKALTRLFVIGSLVGSCVGCDQATKMVAHHHLAGHAPLSFFRGLVLLVYVENPGAFLGLGGNLSSVVRFWVLGLGVALVLGVLAAYAVVHGGVDPLRVAGIGLITGGGLSNLFDRIALGVVRDFINLGIGPARTGIFNLADLAIVVGTLVVLLSMGRSQVSGGPSDKPDLSVRSAHT